MQAGIAVAGDHEGIGGIVGLHQPAQRHHHAFDVGLSLDPVGTFGERRANDLRTTVETERLERGVEIARDRLVRVRVDDANTRSGCAHEMTR